MWNLLAQGISDTVNGALNAVNTQWQYNMQKQLMQKQFDYQKQMYDYTFDKQNQYNLPSEQLARLKQAGLNPNLAYGQVQSAGSSGMTGGITNATPPRSAMPQIDLVSAINSSYQQKALKSQANLNRSQEDYNKAETQGKIIENAFKARQYGGVNGDKLAAALLKTAENQADYWEHHSDHESVLRNNAVIDSAILVAKERNINSNTALQLLECITEGRKPELIVKQIEDIDSKITERQATILYLTAMKHLTEGKQEYQDKLNVNFDKMNDRKLAVLASEIYRNYSTNYSLSFPFGFGGSGTQRPGNMHKLYNNK